MKTLKFLLMGGCVLGLELGSALGQEAPESCTQCICVADGSCEGSEYTCNSANDSGCEGTTFTAACTGNYTMRYAFDCNGGTCAQCFACIFVTDSEGNLVGTCHSSCTSGDCTADCQATIQLTANQEYKLHVCKRVCFGGSCSNCSSCTARGYVFTGGGFSTICSSIPACNP